MMTLEEAITHAEKVAEEKFNNAVYIMDKMKSAVALENAEECKRCADEHRQLAEWLTELAERRKAEPQWIPIKTRPMSAENREYYEIFFGWELGDDAVDFVCKMPEDGQAIWVCKNTGVVLSDICVRDKNIGLEINGDWKDIVAWMSLEIPEPYKEGEKK